MITERAERYACGPLGVVVVSESERLHKKVADTLELYNVAWPTTHAPLHLDIRISDSPASLGPGRYLACARMNVDYGPEPEYRTLVATCRSGAVAFGDASSGKWTIHVPAPVDDPWILTDMESLLSLALTEGWRAAGWVPVHAGTVLRNKTCAIICAESGGGKTTLTAALIRRGWQTLGDDKLLLRIGNDGTPELRALVHTFNLHPRTRSWFPEVGDLERLPVYSEWTEKRKLNPESIWPGTTVTFSKPTHLLQITRSESPDLVRLSHLQPGGALSPLLHQTVVPSDAKTARDILATVVATARQLDAFTVELGEDVYRRADCLVPLERALS